nr:hypothetical protein DMOBY_05800 [Dehalococcoides mccartyi]
MVDQVTVIPTVRQVYADAYASLPTTGLNTGDMGYATDRLVLYRWNGTAWSELTVYSGSGVAADIPAAINLPAGSLYYETDTGKVKQVQGGAWVTIVNPSTGWTTVIKAADETINNSSVYQDDDELSFALAANSVYMVNIRWYVTTVQTFKIKGVLPVGATAVGCLIDTGAHADFTSDSGFTGYSTGIRELMLYVVTGANPGTFQVQWAQITAGGTNTVMKKGSFIEYLKVA